MNLLMTGKKRITSVKNSKNSFSAEKHLHQILQSLRVYNSRIKCMVKHNPHLLLVFVFWHK